MKSIRYITALILATTGLVSCSIDDDPVLCTNNVEITYHYNLENTSQDNEFTNYVHTATEYIFDDKGVLFRVNDLTLDACTGQYVSKQDLPAGKYSVLFIGNDSGLNDTGDARLGGVRLNETRREDLLLSLHGPGTHANPCNNGDRLYYGYRTFSVAPAGTSLVRVDAVHSHLVLKYRVHWKNNPPARGLYTAYLDGIPSQYGLMPEYVYDGAACCLHDPQQHDPYTQVCTSVRHHILRVGRMHNILCHHIQSPMNGSFEVHGEFVAYRLRNTTAARISLYNSNGTRVMKEIDLSKYFREKGIGLDENLRQEFALDFLIDGDQVIVSEINLEDWDEGGVIR